MSISPARRAAFEILLRVDTEGAYASELLFSPHRKPLSEQDHALAYEIVMGVLRWRSRLDQELALYSFTPFRKLDAAVLTSLRMAAYQLRYLDRIPRHAAVDDAVALVKAAGKSSAAGLTNAVLRKLAAAKTIPKPLDLASEFAHPPWLIDRWIAQYNETTAREICAHNQTRAAQHLRVRHGAPREEVAAELASEGVECQPGTLASSALRVVRGDATRTLAFRERRIALQDEGSQWVAQLAARAVSSPARILDCCAAPGGKTLALAEAHPHAQILAAELHEQRAATLRKLCDATNVEVIVADATAFDLGGGFPLVLADVPCTGTGTLRRHPEIKWRLTPGDIADLQQRQLSIARAALAQTAVSGVLVYATCSLEREEGEEVIHTLLTEGRCELTRPVERLMPGKDDADGFFAAVLRRLS